MPACHMPTCLPARSPTRLPTHLLLCLLACSFPRPPTSLAHSPACSPILLPVLPFSCSFAHSPAHSPILLLIHPFSCSFAHLTGGGATPSTGDGGMTPSRRHTAQHDN